MPNKHDDLSDEQLASMSMAVDQQDAAGRQRGQSLAADKSPWWLKLLLALLILVCMAMCGWIYFLQESLSLNQRSLLTAQARIENLQQRLSTTDENMSDSSVAMQLHLKELSGKTEQLWQQMDKLWASAWRRNQKEIGGMSESINTLERDQQGLQKKLKQQTQKLAKKQQGIVSGLGKLERQQKQTVSKQDGLRQKVAQQAPQLKTLQQSLQALEKNLATQNQQGQQNNQAQMNQLQQLQQQVQQLSFSLRKLQQQASAPSPLNASGETGIQTQAP